MSSPLEEGPAVIASAPCGLCGTPFIFDPITVPSILIDPQTLRPPDVGPRPGGWGRAQREPVCPRCVDKFNTERERQGLPPGWPGEGNTT